MNDQHLTVDDCNWLLENIQNPLVRIAPHGRGGMGVHWMRGRLISVNPSRETAEVQPMGHRHPETIELRYLKKWNSRNELQKSKHTGMPLTARIIDLALKPEVETKEEKIEMKQEITVTKNPFIAVYSDEQKEEARKLRKMGKTLSEIATITGIKPGSVYSIVTPIESGKPQKKRGGVRQPTAHAVEKPAPTQYKNVSLADVIRAILQTQTSDTQKLLAIDALVS